MPPNNASKRLIVKHKAIRVLLDTGSSGDLLFLEKGSNKYIPMASRAVQSHGALPMAPSKLRRWVKSSSPLLSILQVKGAPAPGYSGIPQRRTIAIVQPNHWQENLA